MTEYDLLMVQLPETLVSVDARLPNRLFAEALESGTLPEFAGLTMVSPEFRHGESRLDFLLAADLGGEPCVVEVKTLPWFGMVWGIFLTRSLSAVVAT